MSDQANFIGKIFKVKNKHFGGGVLDVWGVVFEDQEYKKLLSWAKKYKVQEQWFNHYKGTNMKPFAKKIILSEEKLINKAKDTGEENIAIINCNNYPDAKEMRTVIVKIINKNDEGFEHMLRGCE